MADIEIKVKIDGIEYTQEQLKDLAKGAKVAGEEVKDLGKETKKAGEEATIFDDVKKRFGDMKEGVLKVVRSFKTLKGAIAATGIGLLLTAFAALIEYFRSSEEGSRKLAIATEAVQILFGKLSEVLQFVGEKIVAVFMDPKQALIDFKDLLVNNIIERFNSLLEVVGSLASAFKNLFAGEFKKAFEDVKNAGAEMIDVFTGVDGTLEKVAEGAKKLYTEVKTAVKQAIASATTLVDAMRNLRNLQQALIVENANLNKELETQQKIAEDTTRTYDERKAALERVGEAQVKLAENLAAQAQAEEALLRLQIKNTKNYEEREELETQLAEATATRIDAETQLEIKKLEVTKITAELEQEELDRKRAINDMILAMDLEGIESAKERAYRELEIAEQQALAELETLKATEAEKQRIRDGFSALRAKLDKDTAASELQTTQDTLGAIGDAFGEGTHMFKVFKSAEAIISTYTAAQKAYESAVAVPILGPVLGPAAAAAAIASGLATVRKINETEIPKAAFGGMITGAAHSAGGKLIEAEGGEYIINKYAMRQPGAAQLANALNSIATPANQSGNGMVPLKTFVVATDVTSAQEANSKVERLARL